jgi:hypothetical protein
MNAPRIVFTTFATLALTAGWAASSFACDKDKATATAAKRAKATMISASAEGGSCGFKTTATAAQTAEHCATMKSTMTAAQMAEHCAAMKSTATAAAASAEACAGKATAVAASAKGADCCAVKGAAAAKSAKAATAKKSPVFIAAANEGGSCGGTGMAGIAAAVLHDDCEACIDMAACGQSLDAAKAHRQVVKLKNGIMLVYTADTPARISAVQAAVASRGEQHVRYATSGSKARLCAECATIRDAIARGKLQREVNRIESGSFMLLTSNDPSVVAKLHGMTDLKASARIKG